MITERKGSTKSVGDGFFDVAVIGAGLVGAVAALAFARFGGVGWRTLLLDKGPLDHREFNAGRAYALSHASVELFKMLEIWDHMATFAQPIESIEITDSELDSPLRPVFLNFSGEIEMGRAGAYIIEHERMAEAIYSAITGFASISGLTIMAPSVLEGLEATDEGGDLIRLEVEGEAISTRLLVGADGRGSFVRAKLGIDVFRADYEQDGIVATVGLSQPHEGRAVQHFLPSGPFAILPLTGDRASLVWTEDRAAAREIAALDDNAFIEEVNKRFSPRLGSVRLLGPRRQFPLSLLVAHEFIGPRTALIGDAAHGVHPLAGQGMNIGLRDVAALVEIVIESHRLGLDFGGATALARYQQWRRFDGVMSAFMMDGLNRLFVNKTPLVREARDFGLRLLERLPPLKSFFVREAAGINGDVPRLMQGKPV